MDVQEETPACWRCGLDLVAGECPDEACRSRWARMRAGVTLPVDELTKLRDEVKADPDRLPLALALAFDMGVKASRV